jgi:LysR family glycine cleavage system transcriptional activator
MSYRIPSLNAIRAFEAAARHLSFKQAANELHVTPGAISQHVKSLEETIGVRLFQRTHKSLLLTAEGQIYFPLVRKAFHDLSDATERVAPQRLVEVLTIGVEPAFAVKWLFPRLGRFRKAHPNTDVRISTITDIQDLAQGRLDLVVQLGGGHYPGFRSDLLLKEYRFPVCSPNLVRRSNPLRAPKDLLQYTLLHDEYRSEWPVWLRAHGILDMDSSHGPSFTEESLAVQATIQGQGISLGRSLLVEQDIEAGRLIRPFKESLPCSFSYYLLCPTGSVDCSEVAEFREWLLREVGPVNAESQQLP